MIYYKMGPSKWTPDTYKYTKKELGGYWLAFLICSFLIVTLLKTCA